MHQQTGCEDLPHKTGLASLRAFWLRANSRSPVQEGYDSEWDHSSRRLATGPSSSSWRESASITSGLDISYPLSRTCDHVLSASLLPLLISKNVGALTLNVCHIAGSLLCYNLKYDKIVMILCEIYQLDKEA